MDALAALFDAACRSKVLADIGKQVMPFRVSMYADDMIAFINPSRKELHAAISLLGTFHSATGLRTNWAKSAVTPIRCEDVHIDAPCKIHNV